MKTLVIFVLFIFSSAFPAQAQDAKQIVSAQNTETILRVEAEGGKISELKKSDLAKLPHREAKVKDHDGKETVFSGIDLREVLKLAGVKFGEEGKKSNLVSYLTIEAADNYRAIFSMIELEPDFTDKVVILADMRDGKALSKEEGDWRLVVPDEKKQARWVRQVVKLIVKYTASEITSNSGVNNSDDEDSIREIVFKKILEHWHLSDDKNLKAYYLSVDDGKDPSEILLKKFVSNYKIPIKKVSESLMDSDIVLNKITREQGVLFSVSKVKWKNKDEATVEAGSYVGNMGSDGCEYALKKENGEWKIVSAAKCYIS